MWYSIVGIDNPNSLAQRLAARPAHLARLQALQAQGKLLVAGPNPCIDTEQPGEAGFSGSIIIAEFASLGAAQQWADDDPYIAAGVYAHTQVKPFIKALP
jgi:uncharacterized protein YciI